MPDRVESTATHQIALVGAGFIGRLHAQVVATLDGFEITAIIDPVVANAQAVSDIVGESSGAPVPIFSTLEEALAVATFSVVVISTPTGHHAHLAVAALDAGKHVLIEKPLDVDLASAARVLRKAAEHPELVVSVISQHRFDPASVTVKAAIDDGSLGAVTSAMVVGSLWRSQSYYDSGQWRGTWLLDGGGALMNQGVHSIDLLVWFLGNPTRIQAKTALLAHENVEVEDTAVAIIEFGSGALATVLYTTAAFPGLSRSVHVHGSRGSAVIDADILDYFHVATDEIPVGDYGIEGSGNLAGHVLPRGEAVEVSAAMLSGHRRQYENYREALEGSSVSVVGAGDAFVSLATVCAIYEAARTGEELDFAQFLERSRSE